MRYKAVIFDFDYTLGDATDPIVGAALDALEKMGRPERPTREEVRLSVGHPLEECYSIYTGDRDPARREEFTVRFRDVSREIEDSVLLPGAMEILTHLRQAGVKLAIVSTKGRRHLAGITARLGLDPLLTALVAGGDVPAAKPDPAGLNLAMEKLGVAAHQTLYVGDTVIDAEAALRAGTAFAAVTTGTTEAPAFCNFPSVCIAPDLETLELWLFAR